MLRDAFILRRCIDSRRWLGIMRAISVFILFAVSNVWLANAFMISVPSLINFMVGEPSGKSIMNETEIRDSGDTNPLNLNDSGTEVSITAEPQNPIINKLKKRLDEEQLKKAQEKELQRFQPVSKEPYQDKPMVDQHPKKYNVTKPNDPTVMPSTTMISIDIDPKYNHLPDFDTYRTAVLQVTCKSMEYQCHDGQQCVRRSDICDGFKQCNDGSDEGPRCYDCQDRNGGCQHVCSNTPDGVQCSCNVGWRLSNDGVSCEDDDECAHGLGHCQHYCHNTQGGYTCSCAADFTLQEDGSSCRLTQYDAGQILFSVGHEIRNIPLNTWQHLQPDEYPDVGVMCDVSLGTVQGLDTNNINGHYYYTKSGGIYANLHAEACLVQGLHETHANVAVDWVTGNIYFVNEEPASIGLCTWDGRFCATLLDKSHDLDTPRGLALSPKRGLMFWTDWGKQARIERANMDGTDRRVIAENKLIWPNAIAIDYIHDLIYFADSERDQIERCRFDGSHREVAISHGVFHPFDMIVFDNNVYWTEWGLYGVMVATVSSNFTFNRGLYYNQHEQPFGLALFHPAYQEKNLSNPCDYKYCSHICALSAHQSSQGHNVLASCLCPMNYTYRKENASECIPIAHTSPKSTVHWCDDAFVSACELGKACENGGTCKVERNQYEVVINTSCECPSDFFGTYCEVSRISGAASTLHSRKKSGKGDSNWLAVMLIVSTIGILGCGIMALVCRHKRYKQKLNGFRWSPSVIFRKTVTTLQHRDCEQRQRMLSTNEDGSKGSLTKCDSFSNPVYEEVQVPVHQPYTIFKRENSAWSHDSDADSGYEFTTTNGSP